MNTSDHVSETHLTQTSKNPDKTPEWTKVKLPIRTELYQEITKEVSNLSTQLGFKVTLPNFLLKTIADHWKKQLEYYKRLESSLKRIRP
jgi:hypothetical protein